jgi:membrane protease YdiL (CAAX protease family)
MILALIAGGAVGKLLHWPDLATYAIGLGLAALTGSIIVTRLRWWRKIGFRRFKHYWLIWIFLAAIVGDLINNWTGQLALTTAGALCLSLLVTVLGAYCEEVFYRGLMLRVLAPRGIWVAAIVTSLLFGLSHLLNAAAGMSLEVVLWQLCYATAYGLAYAGFALRTGTIWPIALTHFLNNFLILLVSGWETQTQEVSAADQWLNIVYTLAFACYGIVLIRNHRKESLSPNTE